MKRLRRVATCAVGIVGICAAAWLTGCGTTDERYVFPEDTTGLPGATNSLPYRQTTSPFQVDDLVMITYSGGPREMAPHEERIKGDGTITPPYIGPVLAAGKSPGQLQKEIQAEYDKKFVHLTATVKDSRVYYVYGEVNRQGPVNYLGETDIVKAISAAGGFTEFAKKSEIRITRAGSRRQVTVNFNRVVSQPQSAVPIYPNDTITVPRSAL